MSDNGPSPSSHDDTSATLATGNGISSSQAGVPTSAGGDNSRKRPRASNADEDDDDEDSKPGRERRKIEIKFIQDKSRRHITFSKRKAGIMKKAYELSVLTGTQVLLLVVSETGLVYTFTTPKLQPLVTKSEGKNLIQACLNAPEPHTAENGVAEPESVDSPEEPQHAPLPPQQTAPRVTGMPVGPGVPGGPYMNMPPDAQVAQAQAYQQYMQQQAQAQAHVRAGGYMPQHPGHPAQNP